MTKPELVAQLREIKADLESRINTDTDTLRFINRCILIGDGKRFDNEVVELVCLHCKKPFIRSSRGLRDPKFCSKRCNDMHGRKERAKNAPPKRKYTKRTATEVIPPMETVPVQREPRHAEQNCLNCNEPFTPITTRQLYCSKRCNNQYQCKQRKFDKIVKDALPPIPQADPVVMDVLVSTHKPRHLSLSDIAEAKGKAIVDAHPDPFKEKLDRLKRENPAPMKRPDITRDL